MMYSINFLIIVLSAFSFPLQAMKREDREIDINWAYKKRKNLFCFSESDREYPYFLSEKEDKDAKRSFVDVIRTIHHLQKNGLPKDIANIILRYSYEIAVNDNQKLKTKLKMGFGINDWDIFYSNKTNKQTLLFLEEYKSLQINGLNKSFAQKMSQNILDLPPNAKQKIVNKYGENMECNIHYTPSLRNSLFGDDDHNKEFLAEAGRTISCIYSSCISVSMATIFANMFKCITPIADTESIRTSSMFCLFLTWLTVLGVLENGRETWLRETEEEKKQRLGFEKISLLQEMEHTIIER